MTSSTGDQGSETASANQLDERYTTGTYLAENADWGESDGPWKAEQVAGILAKNQVKPSSVCDIGCGTGGVLDALLPMLPGSVAGTGYEVAEQALLLAPADRRERIEFISGPSTVDDRQFDVLLALDVFEHLEDYYGFLREIRAKAPLAVFHIPIDTALTTVLRPGPTALSYKKVGHIQHYTRTLALAALRHVGYEIVDAYHTVPARKAQPVSTRQRVGKAVRLGAAAINTDMAGRLITGFPLLVLAKTGHPGGSTVAGFDERSG